MKGKLSRSERRTAGCKNMQTAPRLLNSQQSLQAGQEEPNRIWGVLFLHSSLVGGCSVHRDVIG